MNDEEKSISSFNDKPNRVNPDYGLVKKESVYIVDGYRYTLWHIDWFEKSDEFRVYVRKDGTTTSEALDTFSLQAESFEISLVTFEDDGWIAGDKPLDKKHLDFVNNHMHRLSKFFNS